MKFRPRSSLILALFAVLCFSSLSKADEVSNVYVPEALKPWVRWVVDRDPDIFCPLLGDGRQCAWPGVANLEVTNTGATFTQTVSLSREARVTLVGGGEIFPLDISVAESGSGAKRAAAVFTTDTRPVIELPAGKYVVSGRFAWPSLPESVLLPPNLGLVSLKLNGTLIDQPRVNENGELWLHDSSDGVDAEEDVLRISVSRKMTDGVPFKLLTHIELRVAGKAREAVLGKILPADFVQVSSESGLVHAFDQEGSLKVQIRPGIHTLRVEAVRAAPPTELSPPVPAGQDWPSDETWSWEADEALRSVTLDGAPGIEPQRTSIPEDWKRFPAYTLSRGAKMSFAERRRGEQDLPPNQLRLHRKFWLDLDGSGYTIEDRLSGKMFQEWRVNMTSPTILSRVEVSGQPQLITKDARSGGKEASGVELRSPDVEIRAVSRIEEGKSEFPAVGWNHDVTGLSAELLLPPGWDVVEIFGTDNNPNTWLSSWSLWNIFFLFLVALVVFRLKGAPLGIVTFLALGLSHRIPGAPHYVWLHVIASFALFQAIPDGRAKKWAHGYFVAACVLVAILLLCFSIDQLRNGLFPQLGLPPLVDSRMLWELFCGILLVGGGLGLCALGVAGLIYLFKGQFKKFFRALLISFVVLIAMGIVASAFFSGAYSPNRRYQESGFDTASAGAGAGMVLPQAAAPEPQIFNDERFELDNVPAEQSAPARKSLSDYRKSGPYQAKKQALLQVDQKAVVQTGVGVPGWSGRKSWNLSWSGPVEKGRNVELILISPRMNLVLSIARIFLFVLLLLAFAKDSLKGFSWKMPGSVAAALTLFALFGSVSPVRAEDVPNEELLKELQGRLAGQVCASDCVSTNSIKISSGTVAAGAQQAAKVALTLEATASSDGWSAWPVPGPLSEYLVTSVSLDGIATQDLRRESGGMVWVRVPAGVHKIRVDGVLTRRNSATLQFGIIPQHVEVDMTGWSVDGLSANGSTGESIQLIRRDVPGEKSDAQTDAQADVPLPDWFRVVREVTLGQPWTVSTTVHRLGNFNRAQIMKLPVLPGESITEENIKVEGGSAQVQFPRGQSSVSWTATLSEEPELNLQSPAGGNVTEEWQVRCASIWRCSFEGIQPVHTIVGNEHLVLWRPWPGDKVKVQISKPLGIAGVTETLSNATLAWEPGSGLIRGTLSLTLTSSQGGFRKITLPEGALVQQVTLRGAQTNIMPKGRVLEIPLQPGEQKVSVNWQQPWQQSLVSRLPEVDVGGDAYNVAVSTKVAQKRWLLWASGPAWGPAILFWGGLGIVILFGVLVGRAGVPPLSMPEWIFLGLGTATLHPVVLLIPVAWSWMLERRRTNPFKKDGWFNAAQIFLAVVSLGVVLILFISLYHGLIFAPDMNVIGANSTNTFLRWYVDRSTSALPVPVVFTLPIWSYRAFMLLWSTWLVFLVLRWVRWGWNSLSDGGWWK